MLGLYLGPPSLCDPIYPREISVRAPKELHGIYWVKAVLNYPVPNCNPEPGTRHECPLNEWMTPWSSLIASFQGSDPGDLPFASPDPLSTLLLLFCTPRGWLTIASLFSAFSCLWQLVWVYTRTGCAGIGFVSWLNAFSIQCPPLGSTNSSSSLFLRAEGLWGLSGATSHGYYTIPHAFP